ncbi:MAG: holo-ACP synthase [Armatimonadetes bacterium]|nr:holo-ACP synthase [Armatimonadota bacterium]MBS1710840.1 holo-ACP synthase [Armatimonadota bacterium]MBX3108512.1 holo-ACP synthase [Fimbriimonadaceae bacterium]
MIQAIGTDIVSIDRVAKAMQNPRFVQRILTERERGRALTAQYVAGRWAAKEAVKKCLPQVASWQHVEIVAEPGQPVSATLLIPMPNPAGHRIHLTISHEKDFAVAVAILETP